MDDLMFRCVYCMHKKEDFGPCPVCGAETDPERDGACLPLRTILNDRYFIGIPLRRNGESITYLAFDEESGRVCFVREFYPPALAKRSFEDETVLPISGCETLFNEYRSEYLTLWEKLHKLRGLPGLVAVTDIIETNATVYVVSANADEKTLRDYLQGLPTGRLSWEQARIMFMPLCSTVSTLHEAGILHCGISPDTITVDYDRKLRLTDFAILPLRTAKSEIEPELFDGYCAYEQYDDLQKPGTWTDVYSFAAVLYNSLTGLIPVAAPFRAVDDTMTMPGRFARVIPTYAINAMIEAMQVFPSDRTQTMEEFRSLATASATFPEHFQGTEEGEEQPEQNSEGSGFEIRIDEESPETPPEGLSSEVTDAEAPEEKKPKTRLDNAITILLIAILVLFLVGIGFVIRYLVSYIGNEPMLPDAQTTEADAVITVPNFIGLTQDAIENNPQIMDNFSVKFILVTGSTRDFGQVERQSLNYGDAVPRGSGILLSVSALAMPDLTNQPAAQAKSILESYGLTCYTEYKSYTGTSDADREKSGTVAYTTPSAGIAVVPGQNRMYAPDGNYYDVLLYIWNYNTYVGEDSSKAPTVNIPASQGASVADPNVWVDIDLGYTNAVG